MASIVASWCERSQPGRLINSIALVRRLRLRRPAGSPTQGYISFAIGSVLVYARGVEYDKPLIGQGVRFGILMWLILSVPSFFIAYAVQPVPAVLMSKQVLAELGAKIVVGIVPALVYGKGARIQTAA